jgi:hypothetical protein
MYPYAQWPAADWMDVFNHCPKVTHLRVRGKMVVTLAPTLKERNAFPSLVTLSLQNIDFFTYLSTEHTGLQTLGVVLPVILRARRNAGIPVRRINLTSCMLTSFWIESLREVVDDVVFDFDQGHDSDSDSRSLSSAVDYDS